MNNELLLYIIRNYFYVKVNKVRFHKHIGRTYLECNADFIR